MALRQLMWKAGKMDVKSVIRKSRNVLEENKSWSPTTQQEDWT